MRNDENRVRATDFTTDAAKTTTASIDATLANTKTLLTLKQLTCC